MTRPNFWILASLLAVVVAAAVPATSNPVAADANATATAGHDPAIPPEVHMTNGTVTESTPATTTPSEPHSETVKPGTGDNGSNATEVQSTVSKPVQTVPTSAERALPTTSPVPATNSTVQVPTGESPVAGTGDNKCTKPTFLIVTLVLLVVGLGGYVGYKVWRKRQAQGHVSRPFASYQNRVG